MQLNGSPPDRRGFLGLALGFSTTFLLAGCGGGGGGGGDGAPSTIAGTITASRPDAAAPAASAGAGPDGFNTLLNLAYLGAQYYAHAAHGTGLSTDLTSGVGRQGQALGARMASFSDASIANQAAELADDKRAHVIALRAYLGGLAVAQPQLDLSSAQTSAFSNAAQRAGIVAPGGSFDPYIGDGEFLTGAFLVENMVAATYRTLLLAGGDAAGQMLLQAHLADAIYHGGLIRALLDARISTDAGMGKALDGASAMLAALDGSDVGDQTLAGASGASSNLLDADGRPIPFTRTNAQVLRTLYLSNHGIGGFLPAGDNGVAV